MPTLVSRCLNWLVEENQWVPVSGGCQPFTHVYTHTHTHCICCLTNEWYKDKRVWLDAVDTVSDFLKGVSSHSHLPSQLGPADKGASGFFVVGQPHSWFWVRPWGQAYQAQQLLHHAVSSEQSSILAKAVYYSQIQKANLAFSGLTGGTAIRWDCSGVVWRTYKQSWHLKLSQFFQLEVNMSCTNVSWSPCCLNIF